MSKRYLFMAGGTGGHIFPAIAVAKELIQRGAEVHWLGTPAGMEARIVPDENITLHTLIVKGFRGKSSWQKLCAPFLLLQSIMQAIKVIRAVKPVVVVGFGGFVAAPGGIAARVLRKPLLIHEQNSVAGSTNKLLARLAQVTLEAFPHSLPKAIHIGNPVRQTIVDLQKAYRLEPVSQRLRVLVIGGSLGAKAINDVVPFAVAKMEPDCQPEVWHQTGRGKKQTVIDAYQQCQFDARTEEFINDMADAYRWADLLVCRAGALTVSEVAVAGVPAIFIPLPSAIDNHQYYNAKWLVESDAALMIEQKELTPETLSQILIELSHDKKRLQKMNEKVKKMALPDAVTQAANYCEELGHAV